MTNENNRESGEKLIDELFDNEYFREKLAEFIADNLKVHHRYDLYTGEYDDMSFSICGHYLEVDDSSYGM